MAGKVKTKRKLDECEERVRNAVPCPNPHKKRKLNKMTMREREARGQLRNKKQLTQENWLLRRCNTVFRCHTGARSQVAGLPRSVLSRVSRAAVCNLSAA